MQKKIIEMTLNMDTFIDEVKKRENIDVVFWKFDDKTVFTGLGDDIILGYKCKPNLTDEMINLLKENNIKSTWKGLY